MSIPEATEPDSLSVERALELLAAPSNDRELGLDDDGDDYLSEGRSLRTLRPGGRDDRPEGQAQDRVAVLRPVARDRHARGRQAALLSLPRVVGDHPEGGAVLAQNGRYGPYLSWGKETRSLDSEEQIFTVELADALAAARPAQAPRAPRGQRSHWSNSARTHSPSVRSSFAAGASALYVTDGETNATLRLGDTARDDDPRPRGELLAERRNAEPSTRARRATKKADTAKTTKGDQDGEEDRGRRRRRRERRRRSPRAKATGAVKRDEVAQGAEANAELLRRAPARRNRGVSPRGVFLVFEGIDVSGKSTQARRVAELHDALFTFEPGDTPLGRRPAPLGARRRYADGARDRGAHHAGRPLPPRSQRHRACARRRSIGRE